MERRKTRSKLLKSLGETTERCVVFKPDFEMGCAKKKVDFSIEYMNNAMMKMITKLLSC